MLVAIASENDDLDGAVYERLVERCLGTSIIRWDNPMRFGGHRTVIKNIGLFLDRAWSAGVRHVVIARDNDGSAQKGPEHEPEHDQAGQAEDPDGCRVCEISAAIPDFWRQQGGKICIGVPVQILETWLLVAEGRRSLQPTPEQCFGYSRSDVKKALFGRGRDAIRSRQARIHRAVEVLDADKALSRLRNLRSFRQVEVQLTGWTSG
jgi:hypothetical protein